MQIDAPTHATADGAADPLGFFADRGSARGFGVGVGVGWAILRAGKSGTEVVAASLQREIVLDGRDCGGVWGVGCGVWGDLTSGACLVARSLGAIGGGEVW